MSVSVSRDLRPVGPIDLLDRALLLVRRGAAAVAAPSFAGGALVSAVVIAIYYLERVEGVRSLRPAFAVMLVLAWWGRALLQARSARAATRLLWEGVPIGPEAGRAVDVVRTASVVGAGLWIWLWLLVGAMVIGPVGLLLCAPLLALRGAIAPGWLARAGCPSAAGFRGFARAVQDSTGRRAAGAAAELLLWLGAVGLYVNLFALTAVTVVLARSFLGLDVAFVDQFVSLDNTFMLIVVAAVTLTLLEPVRAAASAVLYVDARVRQEGLDLRAAVDEAIEASTRRDAKRSLSDAASQTAQSAALVALLVATAVAAGAALVGPGVVRAQPRTGDDDARLVPIPPGTGPNGVAQQPGDQAWDPTAPGMPPKQPQDFQSLVDDTSAPPITPPAGAGPGEFPDPADDQAQAKIHEILQRDEFREFADDRGRGVRDVIERILRWLLDRQPEPTVQARAPIGIPLPGAWFFLLVGLVLVLGVVGYLLATRQRDVADARAAGAGAAADGADPRERPPAAFLDDAAQLADEGRFREALRALYLATLVALDRRRLISFDPTLTNWQYMRQMPKSDTRQLFSQFTRLFDYKWYGEEPTTHDDYLTCRSLADQICTPEAVEP